jgi:hypothetical protein
MMRLGRYSDGCLCGAVRLIMNAAPRESAIASIAACITVRSFPPTRAPPPPAGAGTSASRGSPLLGRNGGEIEIDLRCLDSPNQLRPTYENGVIRREDWLPRFDVARRCQHDCVAASGSEP